MVSQRGRQVSAQCVNGKDLFMVSQRGRQVSVKLILSHDNTGTSVTTSTVFYCILLYFHIFLFLHVP